MLLLLDRIQRRPQTTADQDRDHIFGEAGPGGDDGVEHEIRQAPVSAAGKSIKSIIVSESDAKTEAEEGFDESEEVERPMREAGKELGMTEPGYMTFSTACRPEERLSRYLCCSSLIAVQRSRGVHGAVGK